MTTLLTRILATLGRTASPSPVPSLLTTPEEALAFTLSVDSVLLATLENPGVLHFHNHELFYDLPSGQSVCLVTGGASTRADAAPNAASAGQAIDLVSLKVSSLKGDPPSLSLLSYDHEGRVHRVERKIRDGRTVLRPVLLEAVAARVGLTLSGSGRMTLQSMKMVRAKAATGSAAEEPLVSSCPDAS